MPDTAQSNQVFPNQIPPSKVYTSAYGRFSFLKNKLLIFPLLGILLGAVGGFFGGISYQTQRTSLSLQKLNKSLPLSLNILTNPIITTYWGQAEGTVINKDETARTFILKNGENEITIKAGNPPLTSVYDATIIQKTREISFSQLPLKSFVLVTMTLPSKDGGSITGNRGEIVARTITISKR